MKFSFGEFYKKICNHFNCHLDQALQENLHAFQHVAYYALIGEKNILNKSYREK
jgi:hypothetical protein